MKPRLIILLVIAAGAAIFLANQATAPPPQLEVPPSEVTDPNRLLPVWRQPIECEEPDIEPSLMLTFHLDETGTKNRIYFQISEENGFYVDYLELAAWYKTRPETTYEQIAFAAELLGTVEQGRHVGVADHVAAQIVLPADFPPVPCLVRITQVGFDGRRVEPSVENQQIGRLGLLTACFYRDNRAFDLPAAQHSQGLDSTS